MRERDPILEEALGRRLAVKHIAERARITTAAVSQWRRVPERHLAIVVEVTGIPDYRLRPDICPFPAEAA